MNWKVAVSIYFYAMFFLFIHSKDEKFTFYKLIVLVAIIAIIKIYNNKDSKNLIESED